jgi:chloramphenicol O-acetyltransferase
MKKRTSILVLSVVAFLCSFNGFSQEKKVQKYEIKIVTSVESIVPSGLGRSRLISAEEKRDYKDFTSNRSKENSRNKSKRSKIRVKNYDETKLLNFYNIGGIRFQNIAANDAVVSSKLTTMISEGWELLFVTSAVESDAGEKDGQGIFITRYIFKRAITTK